jgi:hypothetical protein
MARIRKDSFMKTGNTDKERKVRKLLRNFLEENTLISFKNYAIFYEFLGPASRLISLRAGILWLKFGVMCLAH